ncbi:hypothetical protein LDENG_00160300, partial [Lucifuga dentata]
DKYLVRIRLIGGKKALTRKQLQPEDWLKATYEIYVMERLTCSLKVQKDKFNEMWSKWIEYITPQRPDLV